MHIIGVKRSIILERKRETRVIAAPARVAASSLLSRFQSIFSLWTTMIFLETPFWKHAVC